jgi:hypothetical protein
MRLDGFDEITSLIRISDGSMSFRGLIVRMVLGGSEAKTSVFVPCFHKFLVFCFRFVCSPSSFVVHITLIYRFVFHQLRSVANDSHFSDRTIG